MFRPRHFAEDRVEVVVELLRRAAFGHLVVVGDDGLTSTPMPFLVDDGLATVRAHLARPNPVWQLAPCDALLIVPVGDAYVSPTWYPSKAEHGKVVPTWNYEVVHVHGRLVAHDDAAWVDATVRELTELHEATMPMPWSVDDAPADYIDGLGRAIVGVELYVSRTEGKRKLSQNKPAGDIAGAIDGLRSSDRRGAAELGAAMAELDVDAGGIADSR